ncbi:MAG: FAD-dependent oxidoreductase [Gammaproteobacteria bacterium]
MQRAAFVDRARAQKRPWDLVIIGGGANGVAIALDAAQRGLDVLLLEQHDFGSGTSSRSSKLIHGGIRYLAQGRLALVREALAERSLLLAHAPGLVQPLSCLMPAASRLELWKFAAGLALYDKLAGAHGLARSRRLDVDSARRLAPQLTRRPLAGLVEYADARFDDTRLLFAMLRRAAAAGATALNHLRVVDYLRDARGRIRGVVANDMLDGGSHEFEARLVVNAAGAQGDGLRRLATPDLPAQMLPSQGSHLVVPRRFFDSSHALVMPRTPDGRVMFALPWHGHVLLGTTDIALAAAPAEPRASEEEIDQILHVAQRYLHRAPRREDVTAVFAGVRPLAAAPGSAASAKVSREHALLFDDNGLLSVSGGKWTTCRLVAEQCVDLAVARVPLRAPASTTRTLELAGGASETVDALGFPARALERLQAEQPTLAETLHPSLPYRGAHIVWAARAEMAMTVADALAFHTRALFIDAAAALAAAPRAATLMAQELERDPTWIAAELAQMEQVAARYALTPIRARDTRG